MKKNQRFLSLVLVLSMLVGILPILGIFPSFASSVSTDLILKENKEMRLWYDEPASDDDNRTWDHLKAKNSGWETEALNIGNSYMGAKVFGITERERIQISEKTLYTSGGTQTSGNTNFAETYLHFNHEYSGVSNYVRDLLLNDATSHVSYTYGDVTYEREYFTTYPDKVMVIKLTASGSGNLNFTLEPKIPYYVFEGKTGDIKTSSVTTDGALSVSTLTLEGNLPGSNKSTTEPGYQAGSGTVGYDMDFEAQYRVFANGGTMSTSYNSEGGTVDEVDEYSNATVTVSGADSAYIMVALGTNYEIDPAVFLESNNSKKLDGFAHPHEKVSAIMEAASAKTFDELRAAHVADYTELFNRVAINLTSEVPNIPTDDLLNEYRKGNYNTYVEELIFAFGRYLLIASSRAGDLPPNLQGVWNMYHGPVCMNAYWTNVNTQMNFWSAFSTDLAECFESYVEFYNAYIQANSRNAKSVLVSQGYVSSASEIEGTLWSAGTGQTAFASPSAGGGRDGWGNTPFMAESFWDYFDYTRDEKILADATLPALIASANFLSLLVQYDEYSGYYLTPNSGSPEQSTTTPYINYVSKNPGYIPQGSTYDQSLTYSNYTHVLEALEYIDMSSLSASDLAVIERINAQINKLDPIPIGASGQVKEFREETVYGEIGEPNHRHISHLTSLYPANVINDSTPVWLDAATVSLDGRGDDFLWGWSYAHHVLARARTGNGNKAHEVLRNEIKNTVAYNMCTLGGGNFQIEANLGTPAGISEMLLQSHNGYIEPLAALPDAWESGSYSGLVARGNFSVGAAWENGLAQVVTIESRSGGIASVCYSGITGATVKTKSGNNVKFTIDGNNLISFNTEEGEVYVITGFAAEKKMDAPESIGYSVSDGGKFDLSCSSVSGAASYKLYVAEANAPSYTLVATSTDGKFNYTTDNLKKRLTFAATAVSADNIESDRALVYFNPEVAEATVLEANGNLLDNGDLQVTISAEGPISEYRLYYKPKSGTNYTLMTTSKYPDFVGGNYSIGYNYYVSVVNAENKKESDKVYVVVEGSGSDVDLSVDNVFSGKVFTPGEHATTTHSGVHSGVTVNYDYTKLTDGDLHYQTGRFSTKASEASQVFDGIIDLGTGYFLNELIIKDFSPTATTAPFMGTALEIQVFSMGKWVTVLSCESNDDIIKYRQGSTYLKFNLGGVRAEKVRIYIPARMDSNSISMYEIECSAILDPTEYDYSDNILLNKPFVPTDAALTEVHPDATYDYGYNVLTDNSFASKGGRFSTKSYSKTQHLDAILELGGIYELGELRIYDFNAHTEPNASNPSFAGTKLIVEAYFNGEWTTVIDCAREEYAQHRVALTTSAGGQYLSFDLSGVTAQKIRIYIPSNVTGSSISLYEIACSGYKNLSHEHTAGDEIIENNVAPDCEKEGSYVSVFKCTTCGEEISRVNVTVSALGHTEKTVAGKAPTCTEKGISDGKICTVCGKTLAEQSEIPELGHSYNESVTAPDCENGGYTTYTCTTCGDSYVGNHTAALGHTEKTVAGKAPTCTEKGISEGKICSVCGKTLTEQSEIPELGHSYNDESVTAPDCENGGYTTYTCTTCGDSYVGNHTAALGHTEKTVAGKAPTCTEKGISDGKICTVCGKTLTEQSEIPELGHSYNEAVTDPDCENGGYTTYTCTTCGDSYVGNHTAALGHTEKTVAAKAPTCTEKGISEGKICSVCGKTLTEQSEIPELGHSYNEAVTAPDCENGGYTTYTCTTCGDSYVGDHTAALGHTYDAVVTSPTCTESGYTTYTCSVCKDTYTADEVAALGHAWTQATTEAPKTCDICGATEGEKLPEPTPDPDEAPKDDSDTSHDDEPTVEKDHSTCGNFFTRLWNVIVNFFRKLFALPKQCVCGDKI